MVNQEVLGTAWCPPGYQLLSLSGRALLLCESSTPRLLVHGQGQAGREWKGLSNRPLSSLLTFAPGWAGFRKSLLISRPEQEARSWEAPHERPIQTSSSVFF